ncbi:MAG: hypothetical protein ABI411_01530 [Tahibacter sp.]
MGKTYDANQVDRQIGLAYGDGSYERITYDFTQRDGQTRLAVQPVDKGWGPHFLRFGLRLSDDFAGGNSYQLITEVNFNGLNDLGGESRNRVELGRTTGLHSGYHQPLGAVGQFYVAPYLDYRAFNFAIIGDGPAAFAEYRRSRTLAAVDIGYTPDADWRLSSVVGYGRDSAQLRVGGVPSGTSISSDPGSVILRAIHDTLDDSGFPTRGSRVDLSDEFQLRTLGATDGTNIARLRWDTAYSYGAARWLMGAQLNSPSGSENVLAAYSALGGLVNLSGFTENQLLATQTALVRVIYYHRLTDGTRLVSVPVYLGGSLEAGGVRNRRGDISGSDLIGAGTGCGYIPWPRISRLWSRTRRQQCLLPDLRIPVAQRSVTAGVASIAWLLRPTIESGIESVLPFCAMAT